jgi:CBS domain-containing protein
MDAELAEIRDFLAQHAPFDALPPAELDRMPSRLEVEYFRRGTVILAVGRPTDRMWVLRTGAVDIRDAHGDLVERAESGTSFGMSALLQDTASAYEFTAIEDSLALALPATAFLDLCEAHPRAREYFDRRHRERGHAAASPQAVERAAAMRTRAVDLLTRPPETTEAGASIRDAARAMREAGVSSLLVMDGPRLAGIVTDRDLRNRVLAEGRDPGEAVSTVMTPDPATGSADSLAHELLLTMVDRTIHHLPVVDGDRVLGVVTSTDLMRLEHANPVHLVAEVARAGSVGQLAGLARRVPRLVRQLTEQAATAADTARVVTAVSDALGRRLVALAEAELEAERGPAPAAYCWVVLGSQARAEQGLASDQDHALVLGDDAGPEDDAWFAALAERVTAGLQACGFARCTGDAMATNPRWRQGVTGWERSFATWLRTPEPDAVLASGIFFDMRALVGDAALLERLRGPVLELAPQQTAFLTHLARHAVRHGPPLGFFRGFVLEREGEHASTLNLKQRGITPVVDLARVHSLAVGTPALGTHARLRAVAAAGRIGAGTAADLSDALEVIASVRLRHQGRQVRDGAEPDNHVDPQELGSLDRRHLRDAFAVVKAAQGVLARSYPLHYLS